MEPLDSLSCSWNDVHALSSLPKNSWKTEITKVLLETYTVHVSHQFKFHEIALSNLIKTVFYNYRYVTLSLISRYKNYM